MPERGAAVTLLGDVQAADTTDGAVVAGGDALAAAGAPIFYEIDAAVRKDDQRVMGADRDTGSFGAVHAHLELGHARPGPHLESTLFQDDRVLGQQIGQVEACGHTRDFAEAAGNAPGRVERRKASWFHQHKLLSGGRGGI